MATRASFWIGDPRDIESREWLGCIAFDGYPDGVEELGHVTNESAFRTVIQEYSTRPDFARPTSGWPYPWADDIFVTDYTYFWDGEQVQAACFHDGFAPFKWWLTKEGDEERGTEPLPAVPAPSEYKSSQPDSIMIISAG